MQRISDTCNFLLLSFKCTWREPCCNPASPECFSYVITTWPSGKFLFFVNSLVLHCALQRENEALLCSLGITYFAHNIMASKMALIFTCRLKWGNKGTFCSPNGFKSNCDNSSRQKVQSPRASWSFGAVFLWSNENGDPSFLLVYFCLLWLQEKQCKNCPFLLLKLLHW